MLFEEQTIIVNRQEIDRQFTQQWQEKLDQFEQDLFSGCLDPTAVQHVINRYYAEMPF